MNHVQRFTKVSSAVNGLYRMHRAGFVSETISIPPTATAANVKTLVEATTMIVTVSSTGTLAGGVDVTFTNPSHEEIFFEALTAGWTTSTVTQGKSLEEDLGNPNISNITYNQCQITPPVGGKPSGITAVKVQIRSKVPGALDSTYTAWTDAIADLNFSTPTVFTVPEYQVIQARFAIVP